MIIPLHQNALDREEIDAACEVLRSGHGTKGTRCADFETAFARYLGVQHAIFVNSGSSANLLAFFAIANHAMPTRNGRRRLGPDSEVIVPAVTWSTTIWPIVQAGAIPVLVDCDPATLQMDLEQTASAITPNTVAICPVHVLGNAVPLDPLRKLADEHSLWIIEDTCEALGTRWNGRRVGSFGDFGTFSFFYSHHITTIEGGMVVTNDDDTAELLRCLRAHGWTRQLHNRSAVEASFPELDPDYLFVNTGFNVRPTEINAALGILQLQNLEAFNRRRNSIAAAWCEALSPIIDEGLLVPMRITEGTEPSWFGFPVVCRDSDIRKRLKAHLESSGIETRPIICGNLARQPAMKHVRHRLTGPLPGADRVMDNGLYWGAHASMTDSETDFITDRVRDFFR